MTIEDWISRARIEEHNYPAMSEDYHNLAQWLEELQGLRANYRKQKEINLELVEENEALKIENEELKWLLKLAIEHMRMLAASIRSQEDECSCCGLCAYDGDFFVGESGGFFRECPGFESDECFVWNHYDEVKGLIEDGNEMDTGV